VGLARRAADGGRPGAGWPERDRRVVLVGATQDADLEALSPAPAVDHGAEALELVLGQPSLEQREQPAAADDDAADVGGPASLERRPDYALEQSRRALGAVLIALAIGLVANSLLGPIATGAIEYAIPTDGVIESQLIALDIFSLAVVAPLSVALGILTLRGHPLAPVLALGPGLYGAYMFPQYILGPENLELAGDSEAFFPLHLTLFVLGGLVAVLAWNAIELARLRDLGRRERLVGGILIPIVAAIAFVRCVPGIIDAAGDSPEAADYREGPTFYWTIALLDLGVGLPAVIGAAIGLRRRLAWARRLAYAVAGWLGLVGPAVGAMAITMAVNDVPDSSAGQAATMTVLGLVFAFLAATLYRTLGRRDGDRA
jgi:hypothetical protein